MACPIGYFRHTHAHTQPPVTGPSAISVSLSLPPSFISSISLSIPSHSVFPFFYSSCLLSLQRLSLCFVAFQSPLRLRVQPNIWPEHAQTQRHTQAVWCIQCGLASTQVNCHTHCLGCLALLKRRTWIRLTHTTIICTTKLNISHFIKSDVGISDGRLILFCMLL